MSRCRIPALAAACGTTVTIAGWIQARRRLGSVIFLVLRDGWGTVQVVAHPHTPGVEGVTVEAVVTITGEVREAAQAPGGLEVHAAEIVVVSTAEPPPIAMGRPRLEAGLPVLLDHAPVLGRHPTRRAVLRLSASAMAAFRAVLGAHHFTEVQTPKLVASATEGGANVFPVDYFGRTAYLAQSPQFYKQTLVGVCERVFEIGPVFRAEPHDTVRHLSTYTSMDVEMGFIDSHEDLMALLTEVLRAITAGWARTCAPELALLEVALPAVPARIPAIAFPEAKAQAWRLTGSDGREEPDLAPAEERALGAWAAQELGSEWLFVTGYPLAKRPFYTHPDPLRPGGSRSFDLLFRGLELVTGGQRLHRAADYAQALAARGIDPAPFASYLQAFRHGMPPHGGFAIGLERLVMQLTGLPNIRLAATFPRDTTRLAP